MKTRAAFRLFCWRGMSRFSGLLALPLAALLLPAPLAAQGAESPAPVAWWLFDEGDGEDILDRSGGGNGAEILVPEHAVRAVDAVAGPALWFDGEPGAGGQLAGYGHVESGDMADALPGPAFSVAAWVRPESFPQYAPAVTRVTDLDAWDDGFGVYAMPGGALKAFVGGYGGAALEGGRARAGAWTHVCLTCDGGEARLYVNGLLRSAAAAAGGGGAGGAPVRVGTLEGLQETWPWHGAVADVRVYGAALPAAEVLSVFAGSPAARAADSLGGGIPDLWALSYGLDPLDPALAGRIQNADGFTNLQKYRLGMNPLKSAEAPPRPLLRVHTPLEK